MQHLLPPYDTKCAPTNDREVCYEVFLISELQVFNRIHWLGFYRQKLNM